MGQWAHGIKNWSIIHINSLIYFHELEIKNNFAVEIKGQKTKVMFNIVCVDFEKYVRDES